MTLHFLTLLEDQGLIAIRGKDAQAYLQGLVTVDVREVNGTQYRLGACCNHKGRVVATFNLFLQDETYYCILPKLNIPDTLTHLKKYAMFSKVNIEDVSQDFSIFGTVDESLLHKMSPKIPQEAYECTQEDDVIILKLPVNEPSQFEVILTTERAAEWMACLTEDSQDKWKQYHIFSGIPAIFPQTAMHFTPQMLNLDRFKGSIQLNKGCYLGQEIIARTASLGSVKKHLYLLALNSSKPPYLGQPLKNAQDIEVGMILEVAQKKTGYYLSAVIQDSAVSEAIYWEHVQLEMMSA